MSMLHIFILFCGIDAVKLFQISFANHSGIICEIDFQKRKRNGKDAGEEVLLEACKNYTAWEYYEAMSFLKDHVKHRM